MLPETKVFFFGLKLLQYATYDLHIPRHTECKILCQIPVDPDTQTQCNKNVK